MVKLVTIFGGSGFLGRNIAQRMARLGWRVRVAVRRPNEAIQVKPYGSVGQVEPVFCNIRDDASVRAVTVGADAVINCVGILVEQGRNKFAALQHEGAARVARIAAEQGVGQLVHISSIGADVDAESEYCRSKALGEAGVQENFAGAIILRPSVMFGAGDNFFNKFAGLSRFGPILPIVGGASKMQPVFVDDVAQAAVVAALGQAKPGVYELGGPQVTTLQQLIQDMLVVIERRRLVLNLPFWVGSLIGAGFDAMQGVSVGLMTNGVLTRDQVKTLRHDNVVSEGAMNFGNLGITPVAMGSVLPEYLWPFRPSGQYAAIKASAKNLKT